MLIGAKNSRLLKNTNQFSKVRDEINTQKLSYIASSNQEIATKWKIKFLEGGKPSICFCDMNEA